MEKYRKFLVAIFAAVAAAIPLIAGGITVEEALSLVLVIGGALGVYAIPNAPMGGTQVVAVPQTAPPVTETPQPPVV